MTFGKPALTFASHDGKTTKARHAEESSSRLYQRRKGARGMLPFVEAATPHLNATREIIHVDGRTGSNWTAMHFASMQGHMHCVKALLRHGAQVNIIDENGMTALHFAAYYGHASVVQALLRAGAEVDAQTSGASLFQHCDIPTTLTERT